MLAKKVLDLIKDIKERFALAGEYLRLRMELEIAKKNDPEFMRKLEKSESYKCLTEGLKCLESGQYEEAHKWVDKAVECEVDLETKESLRRFHKDFERHKSAAEKDAKRNT